ncbi:MAG TPA: hypothetical protein VKU82_10280, partial [Planctomycetaceae bacterium]|nr:hypothetical protein [Planctomycetaceae bacterium]
MRNIGTVILAAVAALGGASRAAADDEPATAPDTKAGDISAADADDDSVDMLFLAEKGPLLIRWHLRRDGKSFRTVWNEFVDAQF